MIRTAPRKNILNCKSIQGKVLFGGREDFSGTSTRTDRGLSDFGWMARYGLKNGDGGNDGRVETTDMIVVMVMQGQLMMELTEEQALQEQYVYL